MTLSSVEFRHQSPNIITEHKMKMKMKMMRKKKPYVNPKWQT